jgi:hypothetical protein
MVAAVLALAAAGAVAAVFNRTTEDAAVAESDRIQAEYEAEAAAVPTPTPVEA